MSTISIQRTVDGVLTDADSAVLTIENSAGTTIVTTPVTSDPTGVYTYTTTNLAAGRYTATWTFVVSGLLDDVIRRAFQVDGPVGVVQGITLAEIEQLVAGFVGPYRREQVGTGAANTTSAAFFPRLKSGIETGDYEDQYLLRRGVYSSGELIDNFLTDDRIRQVSGFVASTGVASADREWSMVPVATEMIELHSLEPETILRPCVLEGLRDCYFWDTADIDITSVFTDVDLSASVPWLTDPSQVVGVEFAFPTQRLPSVRLSWYDVYARGASVMLRANFQNIGTVRVTALRPHFTLVNGEMTMAGPNDDWDVLRVDRRYAQLAGARAIWMMWPEMVRPLAYNGMRPTLEQIASAFTTRSRKLVGKQPEFPMIRWQEYDITQVGNAAEPV
jgi:hypothetical protein